MYPRTPSSSSPAASASLNATLNRSEEPQYQEVEQRILARAKAYGITNLDVLFHLSSFPPDPQHGMGPMRQDIHWRNPKLWCLLLDLEKARFGDDGVKRVWHQGIKERYSKTLSHFESSAVDHLWSEFISTGTRDYKFLRDVCKYEIRLGAPRPSFYVDVVGGLLASEHPMGARPFSLLLQRAHPMKSEDLQPLFIKACSSKGTEALKYFCQVCSAVPTVNLYARVIPYLCSQDRFPEAWAMHSYLIGRGDVPLNFGAVEGLVANIAADDLDLKSFLQGLKDVQLWYENQARSTYALERSLRRGVSSENLNLVRSKTFGFRPKKLSDEFVARAFATTTFSFDVILHGLQFLGLSNIGPLALQQIALNAGNHSVLSECLAKIESLGIDLGGSTYSRVIKKLVAQNKTTMLSDVIHSDQHPDVFEDFELQEKLLAQYYGVGDWRQVDRTLAVLCVRGAKSSETVQVENNLREQELCANLLLRSALAVRDQPGISKIMARMRVQGWRLSRHTLKIIFSAVLPKSQANWRTHKSGQFDDLAFLISLWQAAMASDTHIPSTFWQAPIRRLGMMGRWTDLEKVLFWLASKYAMRRPGADVLTAPDAPLSIHPTPSHVRQLSLTELGSPISRIFTPYLQRAIVEWSFLAFPLLPDHRSSPIKLRVGITVPGKNRLSWARGVEILRLLRDKYGVPIQASNIRTACMNRLRLLFRHGQSPKGLINESIRENNKVSLGKYLELLEKAWGEPISFETGPALQQKIVGIAVGPRPRSFSSKSSPLVTRGPRRKVAMRGVVRRRLYVPEPRGAMPYPNRSAPSSGGQSEEPIRAFPSLDRLKPTDDEAQLALEKGRELAEGVVVYSDLFNASWPDYDKSDESSTVEK